jgi:D-arabinonate dehydratase
MTVRALHAAVVSVPLREPTAFATTVVTTREYVLVAVETHDGRFGTGFTVGGRIAGEGGIIAAAVEHLAPMVVGEPEWAVERLWERMFDSTVIIGRRGAVVRAISAIDIALWDLMAKEAGRPLYQLLGGHRDTVPAYASGGYYREGKGLDGLAAEVGRYVANGFDAVKVKVGRLSPREDAARVRAAREAIGPDVRLAVDANNGWPDAKAAIRAVREMEDADLWWVEEPLAADDIAGAGAVARALDVPIANGELEATRWGFRALLDAGGADIVQADASVAGGVTEWMRIAHFAGTRAVPVAPHWVPNLHVHLVAAVPNGLTVEYFHLDEDVLNFERLVAEPLQPSGGCIPVPPGPGLGIVYDADAVKEFTVSGSLPTSAL